VPEFGVVNSEDAEIGFDLACDRLEKPFYLMRNCWHLGVSQNCAAVDTYSRSWIRGV